MEDEDFMRLALLEAQKAFDLQEVPVGAVAVLEGKVIASAYNQVESRQDASMHAELLCLQRAAQKTGNWRLLGVTLYSTLEPCAMCAGALFSFRVKRVVWGAPDVRQGADGSLTSLLSIEHPIHRIEVRRGVLEELSSNMLKLFFKQRRACGQSGRNL